METGNEKRSLRKRFWDLRIKEKMLITNIGIIAIMLLVLGVSSYFISSNLLIDLSVKNNKDLSEQLGANLGYRFDAIEDFVHSQSFNSELPSLMKMDTPSTEHAAAFNKRVKIAEFSNALMSYNRHIKAVVVLDNYGNSYFNYYDRMNNEEGDMLDQIDFDEVKERYGKTVWTSYDEQLILGSKVVYNKTSMQAVGIVSVAVDKDYFSQIYKNTVAGGNTDIVVLNQKDQVLLEESEKSRMIVNAIGDKYNLDKVEEREVYYNHERYIYTIRDVNKNGIKVMTLVNRREISAGSFALLLPIIYVAIFAVVLSSILAGKISGNIGNNIQLLLKKIREIAKGNFKSKIELGNRDEIGMLGAEFNHMSDQIQGLVQTVSNEKIEKQSAELKALQFEYNSLQAKINPHFLYNTLESINSLAKLRNEDEIARSIRLLGEYLRQTISSKKRQVQLGEEIENIENYVCIQQVSYPDKIKMSVEVDEVLKDALVPKLILQPIVENAIVHGIESKIGKGKIIVSASCDGRDLQIKVWDDGVGIAPDKIIDGMIVSNEEDTETYMHTRIGILAVHKRIQILYGEEYGVKVQSVLGKETTVTITMPVCFEGEEEESEI